MTIEDCIEAIQVNDRINTYSRFRAALDVFGIRLVYKDAAGKQEVLLVRKTGRPVDDTLCELIHEALRKASERGRMKLLQHNITESGAPQLADSNLVKGQEEYAEDIPF